MFGSIINLCKFLLSVPIFCRFFCREAETFLRGFPVMYGRLPSPNVHPRNSGLQMQIPFPRAGDDLQLHSLSGLQHTFG